MRDNISATTWGPSTKISTRHTQWWICKYDSYVLNMIVSKQSCFKHKYHMTVSIGIQMIYFYNLNNNSRLIKSIIHRFSYWKSTCIGLHSAPLVFFVFFFCFVFFNTIFVSQMASFHHWELCPWVCLEMFKLFVSALSLMLPIYCKGYASRIKEKAKNHRKSFTAKYIFVITFQNKVNEEGYKLVSAKVVFWGFFCF